MSYIGNLELMSRDFVIITQQVKNEKMLETSSTQALFLTNEAQRDITMGKLIDMKLRSIKISNYVTNEIQNCQTQWVSGGT